MSSAAAVSVRYESNRQWYRYKISCVVCQAEVYTNKHNTERCKACKYRGRKKIYNPNVHRLRMEAKDIIRKGVPRLTTNGRKRRKV